MQNIKNRAVEKEKHNSKENSLTSGRGWLPLYGFTRQEVGTSSFLLSEEKRRISFSMSLGAHPNGVFASLQRLHLILRK
jgi:hypothetical protein